MYVLFYISYITHYIHMYIHIYIYIYHIYIYKKVGRCEGLIFRMFVCVFCYSYTCFQCSLIYKEHMLNILYHMLPTK